jgi:hypothetical protein
MSRQQRELLDCIRTTAGFMNKVVDELLNTTSAELQSQETPLALVQAREVGCFLLMFFASFTRPL